MASRMNTLVVFLLATTTFRSTVLGETDWTHDCNRCKCVWSSGKKFADCRNLQFSEIPKDLSNEVREIDFSNNPLYTLKRAEFSSSGLQNVHKLKLQNCSIQAVHESAFESLQLLIELDLSNNMIRKLENSVFRDNVKLRILHLSRNRLQHLGANTFANMSHLQRIHLDNNQLESMSEEVFGTNCPITHLSLENNKLTYLSPSFTDRLMKLSSLDLVGNPWLCDCKLEPFRKLAIESNWITKPVECQQPERLRARKWADVSVIFACEPKIVEPSPGAVLEVDSVNYTIPCRVEGDPRPSVIWVSNGRNVDTHRNAQKYSIASSKVLPYWDNLTIINVSYRDRGEYKCVATNPAGSDERNVTVYLRGTDYMGGGTLSSTSMSNMMLLIILLSVGAIILLLIVMLLICCCCKRSVRNRATMSKSRHISQSNEFISMDGRPGEMEKSLLTDVNPVLKPPRQYSVPTSVTSGGTEVSEAKKILIDDESIYNGDDESKLYDYVLKSNNTPKNHLDEHHYPPDLLAFPPRTTNQISPAGSSASTVADTTRLPPHHHALQSPIHSPVYDTSNLYRTLPYSRSHSPFAASNHPVRIARPGTYVTIPRRPRASWSSEPPNMPEISEPLYDNLGLRTTATGASALSLNKLADASVATTPRGARPMHPLSPQPCDTIVEHESPPKVVAATLPRNMGATHRDRDRALSPTLEALRGSWARSSDSESRRDSTASLLPSDGKSPKIPPRPPPKPKKRTSTGPLFEDEGEDGTEV